MVDPKEKFKELYEEYSREKLSVDGRAFLESNLKHKAKKHTRLFWCVFGLAVFLSVWLQVLGIVYFLERSKAVANDFEKNRNGQMKKFGLDTDD